MAATVMAASLLAAPTELLVPLADGPVKVDGRMDDPAWAKAPALTGLTVLGKPGALAQVQTEFRLCHDNASLYVFAKALEPDTAQVVARCSERDGRLWKDDNITLTIAATPERETYRTFIINSKGVLYDALNLQGGIVSVAEYDTSARIATASGDGFWAVEAAIPFADLGLAESSRGLWGINLGRQRYAGGKSEDSSLAPMAAPGFHTPHAFLPARLEGLDVAPFLWKIVLAPEGRASPGVNGPVYTTTAHLWNATGRKRVFDILAELRQAGAVLSKRQWKTFLDQGQSRPFAVELPAQASGPAELRLSVLDGQGRVLAWERASVDLSWSPCEIEVLAPFYKNAIFSTEDVKEIVCRVRVNLPAESLAKAKLAARLKDAAGKVLEERTFAPAAEAQEARFSAAPAVGDYTLSAQVSGVAGADAEARARLRKLPPAAGSEVRLAPDLTPLVNGKPFIPFGFWSGGPVKDQLGARTTAVMLWNRYKTIHQDLDKCHSLGLMAIIAPYPDADVSPHGGAAKTYPLKDEEARAIREFIRGVKTRPALLGYYMCDEPEVHRISPEWLHGVYRVLDDEDPHHPCVMTNTHLAGIRRYASAADIFMPDPYPNFIQGGWAAQPIESITAFMRECREVGRNRKGVWIVPQWFNYALFDRAGSRAPSLVEVRNMFWQAALAGAKGFMGFAPKYMGNDSGLLFGVPYLSEEARVLREVILASDREGAAALASGQAPLLFHAVREAGKSHYLIVVNCATKPVRFEMKLAPGLASETWRVFAEDRPAPVKDGRLADELPAYETRIYTTDAQAARQVSLNEVRAQVAAFEAARVKPGNLAHASRGVRVKASSARFQGYADTVNDGVVNMNPGGIGWYPTDPKAAEHWVELAFARDEDVSEIVVYSKGLNAFEIQGQAAGEKTWKPMAQATAGESGAKVRVEPAKVQRLRLRTLGPTPGAGTYGGPYTVFEIEVYGRRAAAQ